MRTRSSCAHTKSCLIGQTLTRWTGLILRENQGEYVIHNYPQPFAQPECLKLAKLSCKVTKVLIKSFVLGSKSLLFFSPKTLKSLVFSQKTLKSLVLARHPPTPTHGYRLLSKIAYPSKNRSEQEIIRIYALW